jgi:beta-phosphoglucomutase family hydrolase
MSRVTKTPVLTIAPRDYDAVLFDLDGVLTKTARVHAAAWKRLFDEFLHQLAGQGDSPVQPFDIEHDYRRYVDGKPRIDGVKSFLDARGIRLPAGTPDDGPEVLSIQGLGNRKDNYFLDELRQHGVERYDTSVNLVRQLRDEEVLTGVVSSSRNCAAVLEAAGITDLFDVRVDGLDLDRGLRGKPAPDTFLEALRRLEVDVSRAVAVEDAVAGVQAGRAGGFDLVIGVDRGRQSLDLCQAGADIVVSDLSEVGVAAEPPSAWTLAFEGFDPAHEGTREALCTLGNGCFATRGAAPEARADGVHYPGTYVAGLYNRVRTNVDGRTIGNEDLVNVSNWLPVRLRLPGAGWFDPRQATILEYGQELDLRRGVRRRTIRIEEGTRRTTIHERRFVSMADRHVAAIEVSLTPENWSGPVTLRSALDGRVVNAGAALYRRFDNRHLEPMSAGAFGERDIELLVRTTQSDVEVAEAARTDVIDAPSPVTSRELVKEPGYVAQELIVEAVEGRPLVIEKIVALFTSRDHAVADAAHEARRAIRRAERFEVLLAAHVRAWKQLWRRFDIHLEPVQPARLNALLLLRLHTFHLLQTVSWHSIDRDIGVPARGWTGEAYQGHVFWDELFIFPFFNHRMPEITRALLMYRYRRLGEARASAREAGFAGAMFPWQSGSNGEEVTQRWNRNPRSGRWVPDNSCRQRHVGSAIAYNVWQYYQVTEDLEFLEFYGAELILEIARFWASLARFNPARQRYEISGVMGPDEFHDAYPGASQPGLANNAYTNVMAVWVLMRAIDVLDRLSPIRRAELTASLGITRDEIGRWDEISRHMFVPIDEDDIITQFEGYERLLPFDWEAYRSRYGNIQRLDLILEAEGDTPNRYRVSKQADVLMLFYVFSADELRTIFERLGYSLPAEAIPRTVAYYADRTSHGSTLSRVVHAWVFARSDRPRAMGYFGEALLSDVGDIQQGTTAEGIHLGAMAGTVDIAQRVFTGIEVTGDVLRFNPRLPEAIARLDFRVRYRGQPLDVRLTHEALRVRSRDRTGPPIRVGFGDDVRELAGGQTHVFALASADAISGEPSSTAPADSSTSKG